VSSKRVLRGDHGEWAGGRFRDRRRRTDRELNPFGELSRNAKENPVIGGLMIHCYRGLVEKLDNGIPDEPDKSESAPLQDQLSPN
jgi:hypothetical protein